MRIAILTSGVMPVPAVRGGAVEYLIDLYLAYNEQHKLHDITVYSVADKAVKHHPALSSTVNHYRYINPFTLWAKIRKKLQFKHNNYYNPSIEYYLHQVLQDIRRQHYDMIIVENRPGFILKLRALTDARCVLHLHNDFLNAKSKEASAIVEGVETAAQVDHLKSLGCTMVQGYYYAKPMPREEYETRLPGGVPRPAYQAPVQQAVPVQTAAPVQQVAPAPVQTVAPIQQAAPAPMQPVEQPVRRSEEQKQLNGTPKSRVRSILDRKFDAKVQEQPQQPPRYKPVAATPQPGEDEEQSFDAAPQPPTVVTVKAAMERINKMTGNEFADALSEQRFDECMQLIRRSTMKNNSSLPKEYADTLTEYVKRFTSKDINL